MPHESNASARVLEISSRLLAARGSEIDSAITESLGDVARFLGANGAALSHLAGGGRSILRTHAWAAPGVAPIPADHPYFHSRVDRDAVPWVFERAKPGMSLLIRSVDELPAEATGERAAMAALGIQSMAWIASRAQDTFATVALVWIGHPAEIEPADLDRFAIVADLFAAAMRRRRDERALQRRIDSEALLLDLSGRFLDIDPDQVDAAIETGLCDIARFLGANRASFSLAVEGGTMVVLTHEWGARIGPAEAAPQFGDRYPSSAMEWVVRAVSRGKAVLIPDFSDPPPGAEEIAAKAASFGVRSEGWVPARAGGQVVGAIALVWFGRRARVRESDLTPFAVAADVFATALRRRRALIALRRRSEMDRLVLETSSRFLDCPADRVDTEIELALGRLAAFTHADRVVLDVLSPDRTRMVRAHAFGAAIPPRFASTGGPTDVARLDTVRLAIDTASGGTGTGMASIDEIPAEMTTRSALAELGVRTVAWLVARVGEEPVGMILLMWMKGEVAVDRNELPALSVLSDIMNTVLHRKEAERALRESEERFRVMANSAPLIVWTSDPDGRFTFVNETAQRMPSFARAGASVDAWLGEIHPEDRQRVREAFRAARRTRSGFEFEYRLAADGAWRTLLVNGAPRLGSDGALLGFVGTSHDLTDRKRLEEELRQAQKMEAVGRLAGGIAHDFNNLLTAVIGHVDGAQLALDAGESPSRELEGIDAAARRAASLTHQLLAFSRHQIIEPRVVDVNELVAGVEKLLRRVLGEQVLLDVDLAPAVGCIRVDRSQIEQVLINLAANARDAMPTGGWLRIRTERLPATAARAHGESPPGWVRITVRDTGEGMDAETLAHAFEPFFTTKEVGRGTGLGLATCYGIVQQSQGHIDVQSQPAAGTAFEILLPAVETPAEPAPEPNTRPRPGAGSETVLLVEDEPAVQSIIARVLQHSGYRVVAAADGAEARALTEDLERPVEILVTDLVMPRESGMQVAAWARGRWPGIRVLYISGYSNASPPEVASGERGVGFLAKPFAPHELARRIRDLLDA